MLPVGVHRPVSGSYSSALEVAVVFWPPATRTLPLGNKVAVCSRREVIIESVGVHVPVPGSYNSALAVTLPEASMPPVTRTCPLFSSVAVAMKRAVLMLPVAVHVPGVCAVAPWRTVPVFETGFPNESVTDLVHPTTARRRPIEQRTKPIRARGLKKAN